MIKNALAILNRDIILKIQLDWMSHFISDQNGHINKFDQLKIKVVNLALGL